MRTIRAIQIQAVGNLPITVAPIVDLSGEPEALHLYRRDMDPRFHVDQLFNLEEARQLHAALSELLKSSS